MKKSANLKKFPKSNTTLSLRPAGNIDLWITYFPSDISEVEDHFDSAGAHAQAHPHTTAAYSDVFELTEVSHDAYWDTSDGDYAKSELPTVSKP